MKENINDSRKKSKLKKVLLTTIITLILCGSIVIGGIVGVKAYIDYNTTGDGAYNKILEEKFGDTNGILFDKISHSLSRSQTIKHIKFCDDNKLEIYYDQETTNPVYKNVDYYNCYATFEYDNKYYDSLINAEKPDNLIDYLDALNNLFTSMRYVNQEMYFEHDFISKLDGSEETIKKLSELFKLETKDDSIVKQIGFSPYDIHTIKLEKNDDSRTVSYSFKLSGISYCQTKYESFDVIKPSKELLIDKSYDKKHVKTYYRDMIVSGIYYFTNNIPLKDELLRIELDSYINGNKNLEVETTYFDSVNIFDKFFKMNNVKKFNYKKPSDLELTQYSNENTQNRYYGIQTQK